MGSPYSNLPDWKLVKPCLFDTFPSEPIPIMPEASTLRRRFINRQQFASPHHVIGALINKKEPELGIEIGVFGSRNANLPNPLRIAPNNSVEGLEQI